MRWYVQHTLAIVENQASELCRFIDVRDAQLLATPSARHTTRILQCSLFASFASAALVPLSLIARILLHAEPKGLVSLHRRYAYFSM